MRIAPPPAPRAGIDAAPELVGRGELLARLSAQAAHGGLLIEGAAGVGKSALLRAVVAGLGDASAALVATQALASVPFGVFLPLLGDAEPADTGPDLFAVAARLRAVVHARGLRSIAVDDIPYVDPASAGLIHQLAVERVRILATARDRVPPPEAIAALARDGLWTAVRVAPLEEADTGRMLAALLGGQPDVGLVATVQRRSRGNPLFIRELVRRCLEDGSVVLRHGVWVAPGGLPRLGGLGGLLGSRLDALSAEERRLAELVALADPLDWELARALSSDALIEHAEASGGIRFDPGERAAIALEHPLWRDAVLGALPESRRLRLVRELAEAADTPAGQGVDPVTAGRWRLEAGMPLVPGEWLALAAQARDFDPDLAERFLARAVEAGGGPAAQLAQVNLLAHRHRLPEAEAILDRLDAIPLPDQYRIAVRLLRALLLALPGNRPQEALEVVDGLGEAASIPAARAMRASAFWGLGRFPDAAAAVASVLDDPDADPAALAHAGLVLASLRSYQGDAAAFAEVAERIAPLVDAAADAIPEGPGALAVTAGIVDVLLSGEPAASAERVGAARLAALHAGDDSLRAQYAYQAGWAATLGGDVTSGIRLLREARAGSGTWVAMTMPYTLVLLTRSLALGGVLDEAQEVLAELQAMTRAPLYDQHVLLAEAAVLAGRGDLARAASIARRAGDGAHARDALTVARDGWYSALRYGDRSAATPLLRSLGAPKGRAGAAMRDHAQAVASGDPRPLERAVAGFEASGALWYAVEAQAALVGAHEASGDVLLSGIAMARLRSLLARTTGLVGPVMPRLSRPTLTPREAEAVQLAGTGLTDREIADRLGMALRTVQTHLSRAYAKLGVHSRAQLPPRPPGSGEDPTAR